MSAAVTQSQSFLYSATGALLLSAIIGLLIGVAVYALVHRRNEVSARIVDFVQPHGFEKPRTLAELALGDSDSRAFANSPRWRTLSLEMDVAAITIGLPQLIVLMAVATVLVAWIATVLIGSPIGAVAGPLVPFVAYAVIRYLADRQRRLFEEQLPDNLSVVASAMRAGQPFVGALQSVVDSAPEPSKRELRRAVTDAQLGVPLDEALGSLGERLKSLDFQHVALIATLQRETGGNTAEVVELVSDTIRERLELRQMVRSLTAQGRLAGMVLSLLPVCLLMLVSLINPTYMHPLLSTTTGMILLAIAGVMTVLGSLVIKKIIQIDL
ncbi:MAG: type II secretion system F family protein [Solirubrobacteraceae bacterium]